MKFLRREEVDINIIKGDPNQPRKYFDPDVLNSIAATMKFGLKKEQTGLINDIELDDKYVIITGEQRWRSAKIAGKKTIMCKIFTDIDADERYYRQGLENLSRGSMAPMEESDWLINILKVMGWRDFPPGGKSSRKENYGDKHIIELCKKIGKEKTWMYERLSYQNEKPKIKEYLKRPDAKTSIIRSINNKAPKELKDRLKNKVLDGSLKNREVADELILALAGYYGEESPPTKIKEELLETKYTAPTVRENLKTIRDIYPDTSNIKTDIEIDNKWWETVNKNMDELTVALGRVDLLRIPKAHHPLIINTCQHLKDRLDAIMGILSGRLLQGEEVDEE